MSLSSPFIRRPVATTLLTVGIALTGLLAYRLLPVAPLPRVDFPTISVAASLPGASPETMAATVATPLERSLGRIAGITEMTSVSSMGSTRITLQFDLSRDIDGAARDVQAAINAARSLLPSGLPSNPTYRKVNPSDAPIMILALTSATRDQGQMYDAASTVLAQTLSQVEGVGEVDVGGSSLPAVRIEANPQQLDRYSIGLEQVRTAIVASNANRPKGTIESADHHWQIAADDQMMRAADYRPLVVAWNAGAPVRLQDVADVKDSVQDLRNAGIADGRPAVLLIIRRQPGANVIATVDRIKGILPQLRASIPAAIDLDIASDSTTTIRASLRDVKGTLLIATALVILVVFLFLRRWRAATIPAVAVPVSLIGTFGIMYLFGYSIDNLSLMALTIATGFVVDDAVVVLENASRHLEAGMSPVDAALTSAREVGFTVLSMSTSLIAVFVPILLMGGVVGRLLHEFAVTLSAAILVSLVVSLTTTPMMCAHVLRSEAEARPGRVSRAIAGALERLRERYAASLSWALRHDRLVLTALLATLVLTGYLYVIVPKGFMPQQDTGRLNGSLQADQSISFQAMRAKLRAFDAILRADPAVQHVVAFTGGGQRNSANFFVALKPLAQRKISSDLVIARLRKQMGRVPGANLYLQSVQDVRVGGRSANAQYQYTLSGDVLSDLQTWSPRVQRALAQIPELADVNSDQQAKGLQTSLVVDRDRAAQLGVSMSLLDGTLDDLYGQRLVSTIYNPLNQYRVVLEASAPNLERPDALANTYVKSSGGSTVPLSAFARWEPTNTSLSVNHQGEFVATTLSFNLAPGASLSAAADAVDAAVAALHLPPTIHGSFQGTAQAFQASLANQPLLILAALVTIYLVLGVLYESLVHPLTILSTLPSASGGAILALLVTGTQFSLIAFIGVILLIGIVKKNAILMIDFAIEEQRRSGASARDAIYRASLLRFRPILMTTMAALLGAIPLALGHGEGAELRQPLGISIVGGLLVSQLLTLYTTPVVYLYLDRLRAWATRLRARTVVAYAALLILPGCAVGPRYVAPATPVPPAFREAADWVPAHPADDRPRGAWWEAFGDTTLDRLEAQVEVSNQNLAAVEAEYRQALAQAGLAYSSLFPSIGADASATRGTVATRTGATPPVENSFSAELTAAWELDLWGRLRRTNQAAKAAAQASAADLESARLSLHALLAQTYFSMRTVEADEQVIDRLAQGYQQSLTITQNQYSVGVAARSDVDAALAQLKQTQAQGIDLEAERAQLEHALAVLLGRFPAQFALAPAESISAAPTPPPVLPSELLMRRPDVAAAERRLAAASAGIGAAAAGYFPSLSLSGSAGTQASVISDLFTAPTEVWAAGASLAQTLFEAGRTRALVAGARAGYDQSLAVYRQTVLSAFEDVEDGLASMHVLAREDEVQSEAVDAARQALERTLNQYRAGTVGHVNVIVAQATLLNSERSEVDLEGRRLQTAVALFKATGGGWVR